MAIVYPNCNSIVAHLPGVEGAVASQGRRIAARAAADLAGHRVTGAAHIDVTRHGPDTLVSLVDPGRAAVPIEFGRRGYPSPPGRFIDPAVGIYVLTRAAGLPIH